VNRSRTQPDTLVYIPWICIFDAWKKVNIFFQTVVLTVIHHFTKSKQNPTPWKINMEPENHLIEKENHLNQTSIFAFKMLIFRGVPGERFRFPSVVGFRWTLRMIGTRMALALTSHGPMCHLNNSGRVHCLFEFLRLHLNYKMGIKGAKKLPLH